MRHTIPTLVSLAMGLGAAATAQAQEWTHSLTPYLWGSGMSGKAAIGTPAGPLEADVDVGFDDILSNLKIGGMLSYRADSDRWVVMADAIYMDLQADKTVGGPLVTVDASAEVQQIALEAERAEDVIPW